MHETRDATFDGEVLRLDKPLNLPPDSRVRVTIEAESAGDRPHDPGGRSPGIPPDREPVFEPIPQLHVEYDVELTDPDRSRAQMEQFKLNGKWLESHWADLLPQARGKYVVVAGREAFLTETAEDAWAWARATHPEDEGPMVQFVLKQKGPRIHGHRGVMGPRG